MEFEMQQSYTAVLDEMITYSTITIPNAQTSSHLTMLRKEAEEAHKTLKKMVSGQTNKLPPLQIVIKQSTDLSHFKDALKKKLTEVSSSQSDGPFYSTLESSLQELDVRRQAYQGGTFVGNHIHKLIKVSG